MATFSFSQLRALPKDVLVDVVIPMLARESPEEQLQRWAVQFATWFQGHHDLNVRHLPGCHPLFDKHVMDVTHQRPINLFAVLGASELIPFSVYSALHGSDTAVGRAYSAVVINREEMTKPHPRFVEML